MISVYILREKNLIKNNFFDIVASLPFGESEKARITAIKSSQYKWESLGGLVALERLISKINVPPRKILRSQNGKPYFEGTNSLPFGISHSCGISAAAISDVENDNIGFDIEIIRNDLDHQKIARRFFNDNEKNIYEKSGNTLEAFFSIWTAKESYVKKSGQGLASIISQNDLFEPNTCTCSTLDTYIDGHKLVMSICSDTQDQKIQIFTDCEGLI